MTQHDFDDLQKTLNRRYYQFCFQQVQGFPLRERLVELRKLLTMQLFTSWLERQPEAQPTFNIDGTVSYHCESCVAHATTTAVRDPDAQARAYGWFIDDFEVQEGGFVRRTVRCPKCYAN